MPSQGGEGGPIGTVDVKVQPDIFERAWVNLVCLGSNGHEEAYDFLGIDHVRGTRPRTPLGWIFGEVRRDAVYGVENSARGGGARGG